MAPQQSAGFHSFGLEFGKRLNSSLGLAHLSKMGLPAANCVPDFKTSITGWGAAGGFRSRKGIITLMPYYLERSSTRGDRTQGLNPGHFEIK